MTFARRAELDRLPIHRAAGPAGGSFAWRGAADEPQVTVAGYACVFDTPYDVADALGSYVEVIRAGSFRRSLNSEPHVVLRIDHRGLPLASTANGTLRLSEDEIGLRFDADLSLAESDAADVWAKMSSGKLDGASVYAVPLDQSWDDGWTRREIRELSIDRGDVSICTFGANEMAVSGVLDPAPDHAAEPEAEEPAGPVPVAAAAADPAGPRPPWGALYAARLDELGRAS